ncbi:MAG: SseB family protein [Pseudomonadota bacterium]
MTDLSPLDHAHAEMEAAPDDGAARLRFYERLADAELFMLLAGEAEGDQVAPQLFPVEGDNYVLVFDREDRLTRFAEGAAEYAGLSGRTVVQLLSDQGLGLGINLDVAPSATLLPPAAVAWLAETVGEDPEEVAATPEEILPPGGLPEAVLTALDTKLATSAGLARTAYLAGVRYEGGRMGHLLGFLGTVPGAEPALAAAAREALVFSGIEAGALDVGFLRDSDPVAGALARHGLRFDLPEAESYTGPAAPGMDPERPPRLK